MNAMNDTLTSSAASPAGLRGLTSSWGYRHLRGVAAARLAIGIFLAALGALLIARGADAWAALPLAGAAAHFALSYWQLTLARSVSPRLSGR